MKDFHIFWTVSLLVIFVAIILWAFSKNRKADFAEAEQLPLEPDDSDQILPPAKGMER
ncbi:MAG: cbb3-type cytochrome c oxidase subunit 3 [Granulosicoccaceae bacterium]